MEPDVYISFWSVYNEYDDSIVHFLSKDKAVEFMQEYGEEGWYCMNRKFYFADNLDLQQIYDEVTVEVEGDWVEYDSGRV